MIAIQTTMVRLGLTQPAAEYIPNNQGLSALEGFALLGDNKIETLIHAV